MSNWKLSSLAELIAPIESGKRPLGGADTENEGIPSLGGENITRDGKLHFEVINRIPKRFALVMRKGWLRSGDVLINKDGAQTGKVAMYHGELDEAIVNEHVFILRAREEIIDPHLLFLLISDRSPEADISTNYRIGAAWIIQFVCKSCLHLPLNRYGGSESSGGTNKGGMVRH